MAKLSLLEKIFSITNSGIFKVITILGFSIKINQTQKYKKICKALSINKNKIVFENFKGKDGYYCFHAGTKFQDGQIVTNGGRVLGITAKGKTLKEARKNAYDATEWIQFANKYMRHDIGKAIDEA